MFGSKNRRIAALEAQVVSLAKSLKAEIARVRDRDKTIGALRIEVESVREASYGADRTAAMYKRLYEGTCETLGNIAGQETPTANATVKRMARMARSGLPMRHHDMPPPPPTPTNGAAAQAVVS
jgi:hypothetical protein